MKNLVISKKDAQFLSNIGSTYYDLVEEAKDLLLKRDLFKLKIAKLAIKACTIRHGGRSGELYTLNKFSEDCGIHRKRLSAWVLTYKRVVSKIESSVKTEDDWNTASKVSALIAKENTILKKANGKSGSKNKLYEPDEKEVLRLLKKLSSSNDNLISVGQYISRAHHNLLQVDSIDQYDKNILLDINEKINGFINQAIAIRSKSIELMERY